MTNVALVVLDILRKDSFDKHFDWLPGRHYENAYSTSGWTGPVHASLFGGAYPSELGVYAGAESLDCDRRVLAEIFAAEGYTTRGFSANAIISSAYRFDRGFEHFSHSWRGKRHDRRLLDWDDFISQTNDQGALRYLHAIKQCVTNDVDTLASIRYGIRMKLRDLNIGKIAKQDDGAQRAVEQAREIDFGDKEFYFLNLMEAHGPYAPPPAYQSTDYTGVPSIDHTLAEGPEEDSDVIRQAYADSVAYLSDVYEEIFEELQANFDIVVTLGDHGELFGTNGVWSHNHGISPGLVHVPLSIYTGEQDGRESVEDVVSLLDVHKTIADVANLPVQSRGQNLYDGFEPRDILVERFGLRPKRVRQLQKKDIITK
jgi:arylsulfatase A-like enzyme